MATQQDIKTAYEKAKLSQHGISFEQALSNPMFKTCLSNIADALAEKQPVTPTKQYWFNNI
jgi:hypothetical protein